MTGSIRAFVLCLLLLPAAADSAGAADTPETARAAMGDLEVRLLPREESDGLPYAGRVAEDFEIRVAARNRGNDVLLLPLTFPLAVQCRLLYDLGDKGTAALVDGYGWGPAPTRNALVSLAPGETRVETYRLRPLLSGEARVEFQLASPYGQVTEFQPASRPTDGEFHATSTVRRLVDEPRLWQGHIRVSAPVHVARARSQPSNVLDGLDRIDRLAAIDEIAVNERNEGVVDFLRSGLPPAFTNQGPDPVERLVRTTHLVVAARRGYGYRSIGHLLRIVEDETEEEHTRGVALEGAAIALDEIFRAEEGDCVFAFRTPKEMREYAIRIFHELDAGDTPLARRAGALLEASARVR